LISKIDANKKERGARERERDSINKTDVALLEELFGVLAKEIVG